MRRTLLPKALALGAIGLLTLPSLAMAQDDGIETVTTQLTDVWIIVTACLVLFMQAGFLGLELGFSRGKSVGSGVAKIAVNLAIASTGIRSTGRPISHLDQGSGLNVTTTFTIVYGYTAY